MASAKSPPRIQELVTAIGKLGDVGVTRDALASAMGVSKPTVAAWVASARILGHKIRARRVRQGKRGPKALAYTLA